MYARTNNNKNVFQFILNDLIEHTLFIDSICVELDNLVLLFNLLLLLLDFSFFIVILFFMYSSDFLGTPQVILRL